MPINSRQKGAAGERELAKELAELFGVGFRRGQQFSGSPDSPDVIGLPEIIHPEVKRVERLNIQEAMNQAVRDGGPDKKPVVFHRRNRGDWMVTVLLSDWIEVSRSVGDIEAMKYLR